MNMNLIVVIVTVVAQMSIGFSSERLEQADWGQSQLDRFGMFKKQVER